MLPPYGSTCVATHGGGSYGGSASLILVPEKRFAYAAFGNGSTASALHDRAEDFVLHDILGLPAPEAIEPSGDAIDPARYTGTFARQYITTRVTPGEAGGLVASIELTGEEHRQLWRDMMGRDSLPPMPVTSLTPTIFVPSQMAGKPVAAAKIARGGPFFLDPNEHGRYYYLSFGGRMSRRID
jgi:hypothetical protein